MAINLINSISGLQVNLN